MTEPGYKYLTTYKLATVIYDLTIIFCKNFIHSYRQKEQMEQAGRSDKSNIAEGSTMQSLEGYIKLLGTAEGSVRELADDYEDYLRQNGYKIWLKDNPKVREFRNFRAVWVNPNIPNTPILPKDPEEAANMLLTFCQMQAYLLSRQIDALTRKFIKEGGFRENLFKKRLREKRFSK